MEKDIIFLGVETLSVYYGQITKLDLRIIIGQYTHHVFGRFTPLFIFYFSPPYFKFPPWPGTFLKLPDVDIHSD
jgi:hypothetical protein